MTFTESIKTCLNKYVDFSGRASRSEYWWFALFIILTYVAFVVLASALPDIASIGVMIFGLGTLLPQIAVGIRRLHDTDKSGWWLLLSIVPVVSLVLIYFFAIKGTDGDNQFGSDPLA